MAAAKTPQLELSLNCGRSEFLGHQKLFHFPPNTLVWWSCWVRTDPSWWISNNSIQHVQINFASGLYIYICITYYIHISVYIHTHIYYAAKTQAHVFLALPGRFPSTSALKERWPLWWFGFPTTSEINSELLIHKTPPSGMKTRDLGVFHCVARSFPIVVICSFTKDEFLRNRFSSGGGGTADLKFSLLIAGLHIEIIQR